MDEILGNDLHCILYGIAGGLMGIWVATSSFKQLCSRYFLHKTKYHNIKLLHELVVQQQSETLRLSAELSVLERELTKQGVIHGIYTGDL